MVQLTLTLLGGLDVHCNGEPLTRFRSDKVRALLVYLALEPNRPHPRSTLAGLLWPEVADKQANESLRVTLYRLRQALDSGAPALSRQLLAVTRHTISFRSDTIVHTWLLENQAIDHARTPAAGADVTVQIDAATFRSLMEALQAHSHTQLAQCAHCLTLLHQATDLYQGELLAGFSVSDAPAFEEWLLLQREIFHQQALMAAKQLAESYEAIGDYQKAHTYAIRLLALDPYREAAQRQLLRLLAILGLPDQALARYADFRQLLRGELDAEPEIETVTLVEQIRRGEVGQTEPEVLVRSPQRTPAEDEKTHPSIPPRHDWHEMPIIDTFFGRKEEIAQLRQWLVVERCRLVAVLGFGGLGKTSLTAYVAPTIAEHFDLVIWRSMINAPPLTDLLATLMPVLSEQQVGVIPGHVDQQMRLFFAYLQERRVLLVLDNLEALLQAGEAGHYRPSYETYGQLVTGFVSRLHQGQLLLTSRERPPGHHAP